MAFRLRILARIPFANSNVQVNALENVFAEQFHYKTEQYQIPAEKSQQSLLTKLQGFIRCYEGPSQLGIIYYGGHADRKETAEGIDLEIFARRTAYGAPDLGLQVNTSFDDIDLADSPTVKKQTPSAQFRTEKTPDQPRISFRDIYKQIEHAETDSLLIVDSCFAAGAFSGRPFGGRKSELLCSIAEGDRSRAPGREGSFTKVLIATLLKMLEKSPTGFDTSTLYSQLYTQQHYAHKPFHFVQSRYDYGRIWLRPCPEKNPKSGETTENGESKYTIDVRGKRLQ